MKPNPKLLAFLVGSSLLVANSASAQSSTWNITATGTYSWQTPGNWTSGVPSGAGVTANLNNNIVGKNTINLDGAVILGTLNFSDSNGSNSFELNNGTSGSLTFNNNGSGATINESGSTVSDIINASITLADNLNLNVGGTLTLGGAISQSGGARSLTKSGGGTLTLNADSAHTGTTTISGGTLTFAAASRIANTSKISIAGSATLSLTGTNNNFTLASGANIEGTGTGIATFNTGSSTTNGIITTADTAISHTGAGMLKFQRLEIRGSGNEMTSGKVESGQSDRRGLIVGNNAGGDGTFTISGGTFTSLGGGINTDLIGANGVLGTLNISGGTYVNANTLAFGTGSTTTLGGGKLNINSGSATIGTLLYNSGTVTNNQGIVNLNGGTLTVDTITSTSGATREFNFNGGQFVAGGAVTFADTLTLNVQNGGAKINTNGNNVLISGKLVNNGTGGLTKTGSGTLTLSGDNTFVGGTSVSGDGALTLTHSNAAGGGTISFASTQTGTAATFTLSGGINVGNAIVMDASTGRNSIASTGGSNTLSGNITVNNNAANAIVFINNGGAGTTFTVGDTTSDTITASTFTNILSFRGVGTLNSRINSPSANFNLNSSGVWTINSTNNSWAVTSISNGNDQLILGANNALATGARVEMNAGGQINLNGFNQTVAGLAGNNSTGQILNNSTTTDSILTLSGLAADRNYLSAINDGTRKISLVMDSSGRTQTLSGDNSYTGTTTISAGTLVINGDHSAATGAVTVASGSGNATAVRLKGTGTIGGATTFAADPDAGGAEVGGIHSPGTSVGRQSFTNNLTYSQGSIFEWELGATLKDSNTVGAARGSDWDAVNVSGTLATTGTGAIFRVVLDGATTFADTFWSQNRTWTDIFKTADAGTLVNFQSIFTSFQSYNYGGVNGALNDLGDISSYGSFAISGSSLNWTAIPEPTTALAGLLLTAGLLRRRRA